jgi:hypothetical protein
MSDSIMDSIEALFNTNLPGKDIVGLIKTSWDWFPTNPKLARHVSTFHFTILLDKASNY